MPEVVYEQYVEAWWAARRGKITASCAAACLGLDPHRGPFYAYQEITGAHKTVDRYRDWAADKETEAREAFEKETGLPIKLCGFYTHPDHPWMGGSPDGLCGDSAVLEIKNPKKGLPKTVPIHHRIQVLIQLAVTGRKIGFYFSYEPGNSRLWVIRASSGTAGLIARLKRFYDTFIATNTPPPRRVPGRKKRQKSAPVVEPALSNQYPFGGDYET